MNDTAVLDIAMKSMMISAKLAAPILIVSLVIGVGVSLLQSVTQVQEYTVSFVPKLLGIAVVLALTGSWMLHEMVSFTQGLFASLPAMLGQ